MVRGSMTTRRRGAGAPPKDGGGGGETPPRGEGGGRPPVNWGDPDVLRGLLEPHGDVEITEHELHHADATPEKVWDRWERSHPMWIGARRLLEPAGGGGGA